MKNKIKFAKIILASILGLLLTFVIGQSILHQKSVNASVFKTKNGYGYTVTINNKVVIKQAHIPATSQPLTFCSKKDALRVSEVVIKKLNLHENPAVTIDDLTQNNIKLNCFY